MDTRYIVAIEIGSSKVKGIAATVGDLGDLNVIAVEEVRVDDCVRYGKIQNVQEVSTHVNDIIRKIENNPRIAPRKVSEIFISIGGRTLSTAKTQAQRSFPGAVEINADTIKRLENDASFGLVTDKTNLAILPYAFFVDNSEVKKVVGMVGNHIRAIFTVIGISPTILDNIKRIKLDGRDIHFVVRPTAIADLVLSQSDKQIGCALVDFGSETTTITIYKDQVLQNIITLPIGARNITRDLMTGLAMTEESAEAAKIAAGVHLSSDSKGPDDIEINNYISARAGEIIANVMHQIEAAGFKPQSLKAGIILTGGGARLRNFDHLVEAQTKMPVRIAAIDNSAARIRCRECNCDENIDILSIAKYAADNFDIDCMTAVPADDAKDQLPEEYNTIAVERQPHGQRSYIPLDDENLLKDDVDEVETPHETKSAHVRVKAKKAVVEDNPDEIIDDNISKSRSIINTLREKMGGFMTGLWDDPREDKDDIDDLLD